MTPAAPPAAARSGTKAPIQIKTAEEIAQMRAACQLAAAVLDYIEPFVTTGATTGEIDRLCHAFIVEHGGTPAALNYCPPGHPPYPKSVCTSINHQVCHGIPSADIVLKSGDILNIDIAVIKDGWYGDTSRMFTIGAVSRKAEHICEVAHEALQRGIAAVREGATVGDIGHAIQAYVEKWGCSIVRDFCGHGLGRDFHEPPQVLHYGAAGSGATLKENMVFTIEPMVNAGRAAVKVLSDKWTVVTRDRSLSAQWEHTVRVTKTGSEILTASHNAAASAEQNAAAG